MQVETARLLRRRRPERVLVELPDPSHHARLLRVLAERPLVQYVEPGRLISLPQDAALEPEALEI
jgi:hypothetical protein